MRQNEIFVKERNDETKRLLKKLSYKFAYFIFESGIIPLKYWKSTFIERNPFF